MWTFIIIYYRLSGASLVAPLVNFWWSRVPQNLLNAAMKKLPFGFQMTLGIAHYFPWLLYWWMTQKWFPNSGNPKDTMTERDVELAEKHTQHPYIKVHMFIYTDFLNSSMHCFPIYIWWTCYILMYTIIGVCFTTRWVCEHATRRHRWLRELGIWSNRIEQSVFR